MADVVIYTRPMCVYCSRAKALLEKKSATFEEIHAGMSKAKREEMIARSNGGRTFPQIFINGEHIGGCDDLYALDQEGRLDALLAGDTAS